MPHVTRDRSLGVGTRPMFDKARDAVEDVKGISTASPNRCLSHRTDYDSVPRTTPSPATPCGILN